MRKKNYCSRVASVSPAGELVMMGTREFAVAAREREQALAGRGVNERVAGYVSLGRSAEQVGLPFTAINYYRKAITLATDDDMENDRYRYQHIATDAAHRVDRLLRDAGYVPTGKSAVAEVRETYHLIYINYLVSIEC